MPPASSPVEREHPLVFSIDILAVILDAARAYVSEDCPFRHKAGLDRLLRRQKKRIVTHLRRWRSVAGSHRQHARTHPAHAPRVLAAACATRRQPRASAGTHRHARGTLCALRTRLARHPPARFRVFAPARRSGTGLKLGHYRSVAPRRGNRMRNICPRRAKNA